MHLLVTRPDEDAAPLRAKLEAMGHRVSVLPLLRIVAREGIAIPDLDYQLAVATSANGIRSLRANDHVKSIRMLTVGPQSLAAARAAGFIHAGAQGGDVAGLAQFISRNFKPDAGPILYLSGAETSGDLQGSLQELGFTIDRVTLYDAVPAAGLGAVAAEIRAETLSGVLLYSPRTARIWRALIAAEELESKATGIRHYCLSANVAAALPPGWPQTIAKKPEEAAMLGLLEQNPRTV